jgi:hypothetical protein
VSLFIRDQDLGFVKSLFGKAPFFLSDSGRKISDGNAFLLRDIFESGCFPDFLEDETLPTFR